jgi:two-component system, LuxR family, sensor kinase FixL
MVSMDKENETDTSDPERSKRNLEKRLSMIEKKTVKAKSTLAALEEEREKLLEKQQKSRRISQAKKNKEEDDHDLLEEATYEEKSLWPREARYRELIESLHEGVWLVDEKGIILYSNPQMAKMLGYSMEEIIGRSIYDFMDKDIAEAARRDYEKRRKGESGLYERQYIKKDGERLYALVAASPLFDKDGRFKGSLAGILDITVRKQIEERLAYQSFVLENVHEAVIATDLDFRITSWNKAAEELYGWTASEAIGKPLPDLVGIPPVGDSERMNKELKKTGRTSSELVQTNREGKPLVTIHATLALRDQEGRVTGYVSSIRDISLRKKAEADLKMYAQRLERSNKELEEFALIASHDLKEPLRKVKSFGEFLKERAASKLNETELDFLERMIGSTKRMQEMIEGLLELAKVSSSEEPYVEVNLDEVLNDVIEELAVIIEERNAMVEVGPLSSIQAGIFQMHQLFRNLVWNALKYVEAGKQPIVRVYEYREEQKAAAGARGIELSRDNVWIAVEDNGIGFRRQEVKRIFLPFQRLHGKSIYEGSGIGLAVCRKIVERHGGTIVVKSVPGEGSTFIVRLPANK